MIPNFKMGYYHHREYLERPCNNQMSEKLAKKPMREAVEGFDYSSLLTSKTYSILSYVVGGFVGSKSQMNNNKHNLSYDLSAAIFNLLNPCKYERERSLRKSHENFYNTPSKLSSESYDKYIVKSSHKGKMINLRLEWLENYVFGLNEQCFDSSPTKKENFNCDESRTSGVNNCTMEDNKSNVCLRDSVDVTDRVSVSQKETPDKEHINNPSNYKAHERCRLQSECSVESTDSESFIVFDCPDEDGESQVKDDWNLENFDLDSEDDDDDDDNDNDDEGSCYDEYEICSLEKEILEANEKWCRNYQNVKVDDDHPEERRKVRFKEDVKVRKILAWDYAYRAARTGPWEQMARDRARFRERIHRLALTISPVLKKEHRDKIYKELYS